MMSRKEYLDSFIDDDIRAALTISRAVDAGDFGEPNSDGFNSAFVSALKLLQKSQGNRHKKIAADFAIPKIPPPFDEFVKIKLSAPWLPIDDEIFANLTAHSGREFLERKRLEAEARS